MTVRSPRVQMFDCSRALRGAGWSPAESPIPLRRGEHQLRLLRGETVYSTPILASPLECWRRAVHDLLGPEAQPRYTTGGRANIGRSNRAMKGA